MRGGGAHIFFPQCESVQLNSLWARCDSAWNRSTAVGGGSLNVNTKDHHFVNSTCTKYKIQNTQKWARELIKMWTQKITILWLNFSTLSPYNKVHNWRWYNMRVRTYLRSATCLSRVHCAWNCWGWGLIWVRGLSARASHSYGGASPRASPTWVGCES